jgi:uncharacterized repeat protein (TIGR03803 family)
MFKSLRSHCAIMASVALLAVSSASAAAVNTEFVFRGNGVGAGGAIPLGGNLLYRNQQFYGTTYAGGTVVGPNETDLGETDLGAIYQYAASGLGPKFPVSLYVFSGPDGAHPNGTLVADAHGNLYGTTQAGGTDDLGTVFRLSPPKSAGGTWTLVTLHNFTGPDGANPGAGVTIGPDGKLYGTTMGGGLGPPANSGVVYTLSTSGTMFRVMSLLSDSGGEGRGSRTNVVVDPQGNVLGTTFATGQPRGAGSVFKVTQAGINTTVAIFLAVESPDGTSTANPIGNFVRDVNGNLYGMLERAVTHNNFAPTADGAAVYKIDAFTHTLHILAILNGQTAQSGVVRDGAGNLYGTTVNGGTTGTGSVFSISPSGVVTTLASLSSANLAPASGVILDPTGKLWGTSSAGGVNCATSSNVTPTGCGTLFSLTR